MRISCRNGNFLLLWQRESQRTGSKLFSDRAMLLIQTYLQGLLTVRVKREQIKVIIRSPVQHSPAEVDGSIDERRGGAAVFRLDVIGRIARLHVGIVTKKHFPSLLRSNRECLRPAGNLPPHLTDWRSNRYYSASPMSGSGLHTYAPLLLHLLIAAALAGALTTVSVLVGWRRPSRAKQQPYECGLEPTGDARAPISVKFYLVAMVFILFDVEAIFLYPWAYIFRSLRWYGFGEMMLYIAILLVGYVYLWKKGALDWHN